MRATRRPTNLNRLSLAIGGLALLLVIAGTFGRRSSPGERDLVVSGRAEQLFNGRNINGWRTISGGWNPAKNEEGAIVLQGRGAIRRPLLVRSDAGQPQPLEHYRLTFVVDLHDASAVELQFDFDDADGKCRVVRIDRQRSEMGRRGGSQSLPRVDSSIAHASGANATGAGGALHAIQLERQSQGWWVFVDEHCVGSAKFDEPAPASEFGLQADGGPAWFSDFTVEELAPAGTLTDTR